MLNRSIRWLVALACIGFLSACAGEGPPPSSVDSGFDAIQRSIFNVSCLLAGCHNSTDRSGNMVLEEGQAYSNLVNVSPAKIQARAAGLLRVAPGDPARSFLLIKLIGGSTSAVGGFDPRYGSPMPKTGGPLSSADIDQIRSWILAGAPPGNTPAATAPESTPTPTASPSPTLIVPPPPTVTPSNG